MSGRLLSWRLLPFVFALVLLSVVIGAGRGAQAAPALQANSEVTPAVFTEESVEATLAAFVGTRYDGRYDRTAFTEREAESAEYLAGELQALTDTARVMPANLLYADGVLNTRNVVAEYNPGKEKRIVIGAHYDNLYSAVSALGVQGDGSAGVLNNATGVAAVLVLAQHVFTALPQLDYTLTFVLFGGGAVGASGSYCFVRDYLNGDTSGVALMINLKALAGDKLYTYSDEVATRHGTLFRDTAAGVSGRFNDMPRHVPLLPSVLLSNLAYSHEGIRGDNLPFIRAGVNTLNLFGGKPFSFNYAGSGRADSLPSFVYEYPDYAAAVTETLTALSAYLTAPTLLDVLTDSGNPPGYAALMRPGIASGIALGLIILSLAALVLVVMLLDKKAAEPPAPTPADEDERKRIAVFGEAYEENGERSDARLPLGGRPLWRENRKAGAFARLPGGKKY